MSHIIRICRKSTPHISIYCSRLSGWQRLTYCQFHPNLSIPLRSPPSNFRRHWIKSESVVEVRQRLVWGSPQPAYPPLSLESRRGSLRSSARRAGMGRGIQAQGTHVVGYDTWKNKTPEKEDTESKGKCITRKTMRKLITRHLHTFVFNFVAQTYLHLAVTM